MTSLADGPAIRIHPPLHSAGIDVDARPVADVGVRGDVRIVEVGGERIGSGEPALSWVVVAGPQVVVAGVGVEVGAGEAERVVGSAGVELVGGEGVAEGVVR